jgi:hypothetical protein
MMTRAIKKHDLQAFLKNEVASFFGSEWIVGPNNTLQRRSGYFVQGFSLFRLSFGPFRVYLFNRLLALILQDNLNVTLTTLKEQKSKLSAVPFFNHFSTPKEALFDWDQRFDDLPRMAALICDQLEPDYAIEIDLQTMLNVIGKEPQLNEDFQKAWARSIIRGLLGDMQFARQAMEHLIEIFGATAAKYADMGVEPNQTRIECEFRRQSKAEKMYEAMNDETTFRDYCDLLTNNAAIAAGFMPTRTEG